MKHTRFTPKEKTAIVMESIKTNISTADLCRKHRVSPHTFARWMDRFIEGGKKSLSQDGRSICSAQKETDNLKGVIAEYAIANEALKKTLESSKR